MKRKIINEYLDYLKYEKHYSKYTITSYRDDIVEYFDYIESEGLEYKSIEYSDIRFYLMYLKDTKKDNNSSIDRKLRGFYKYLANNGVVKTNVFSLINGPKKGKKLPRFFEYNELEELFNACDLSTSLGQRDRLILEMLYATGVRVGELVSIKLSDIDESSKSILILGTSDGMVQKIAANLGLPEISETTYISDVATQEEMETARRIRVTEGKHVIPVPTFEIKKDFSGYLLDPLQIFKTKGRGKDPYISEKSIIRPTFSYMGKFTISDTVFRQIIEYLASKTIEIHKVQKIRVDNFGEGVKLYMEVTVVYGFNVVNGINEFKAKAKKEIEKLTAMNVEEFEVVAKNVYIPKENM